jgi:hypothetical protein
MNNLISDRSAQPVLKQMQAELEKLRRQAKL